jgi:hypothetical protein
VADDKPLARWVATALWRSLHCYIGAFMLLAALLVPYTVHCSQALHIAWADGIVQALFVWDYPLWALVPAFVLGLICAPAPPIVWKWMRLAFIGLLVVYAVAMSAAPASWWAC